MKNHLPVFDEMWQITNIRFVENDQVVEPQIKKIDPKDSFAHEIYPDLSDWMAHQAYVRARLFNRYEIKFDLTPAHGPDLRRKIELLNENAIDWPFTMDDADCNIATTDEYYTIKWPSTWFLAFADSVYNIIEDFIPAANKQQALEQLAWEFLMNTLPLDVT